MRRIALVRDLLIRDTFEFTGAALDGALNGVDRHGTVACFLEHCSQRWVHRGIAATFTRRNLHLTDQLGEHLGALLISSALLMFDRRPFGMSRHWCLSYGSEITRSAVMLPSP